MLRITCGLRCHNAIIKTMEWSKDNPNDPENYSINVIIKWMTMHGNYSRFKGGQRQKRWTKQAITGEISNLIKEAGCIVQCNPKAIIDQITSLVKSYSDAIFEKNQTGQSTAINSDENEHDIYKICKYFDQLDPILRDQPLSQPLLINKGTSDALSDDDVHESDSTPSGVRGVKRVYNLHYVKLSRILSCLWTC